MPVAWYVCPYDTVTSPTGGVGRSSAIRRYIPSVPNPDGSNWDEAEVVGNSVVVKVSALAAVHVTISADPDFLSIPTDMATVPAALRVGIRTRLNTLGYTDTEINGTGWSVTQLLALLTTAASVVTRKADNTGFEWTGARRVAPKTVAQIEERLPG